MIARRTNSADRRAVVVNVDISRSRSAGDTTPLHGSCIGA
jgi:hypothetical protein